MNPEAQAVLDGILKKDPSNLTTDDIKFLRARRDYLKKIQLEEYDSILNPKNQTSEKETVKTKDATK